MIPISPRFPTLITLWAVVVLTTVQFGCPKPEDKSTGPTPPAPKNLQPIDPATVGTLRGGVSLGQTPKPAEELVMRSDYGCVKLHDGPVFDRRVQVLKGKLANAFVYIKQGMESWKIPPAPEAPVKINQVGCLFEPMVAGARVGQEVLFLNGDSLPHNVHGRGKKNGTFNRVMASKGQQVSRTFKKPDVMLSTTCDIHPWMAMHVGIVDHPHFAVTGADGTFSFEGVPPGEYVVEAWHRVYGTQTRTVTLEASGETSLSFEF
jgi:plastocyanin